MYKKKKFIHEKADVLEIWNYPSRHICYLKNKVVARVYFLYRIDGLYV